MKAATISWIITSFFLLVGVFREFLLEGGLGILSMLFLTSLAVFLVALLYFSLDEMKPSA